MPLHSSPSTAAVLFAHSWISLTVALEDTIQSDFWADQLPTSMEPRQTYKQVLWRLPVVWFLIQTILDERSSGCWELVTPTNKPRSRLVDDVM